MTGTPQDPDGEAMDEDVLICFAAGDCHGEVVLSLESIGDCCTGKGLSYRKGAAECINCFRKLSVIGTCTFCIATDTANIMLTQFCIARSNHILSIAGQNLQNLMSLKVTDSMRHIHGNFCSDM